MSRFPQTHCSQCGGTFGPGDEGSSECDQHEVIAPARDQARFDLVSYGKALVANRSEQAVYIERKYGLYGHTPQVVSIGLQAAAEGRDHMEAVDEYLEDEEA